MKKETFELAVKLLGSGISGTIYDRTGEEIPTIPTLDDNDNYLLLSLSDKPLSHLEIGEISFDYKKNKKKKRPLILTDGHNTKYITKHRYVEFSDTPLDDFLVQFGKDVNDYLRFPYTAQNLKALTEFGIDITPLLDSIILQEDK